MSPVITTSKQDSRPTVLSGAYQQLAEHLFAQCVDQDAATLPLGITAIEGTVGTSTIAGNLAIASARSGRHTLLVTSTAPFGDHRQVTSLHDVSKEDVEWVDAVHSTSHGDLYYAVYGQRLPCQVDGNVEALLQALMLRFERIIIDLPTIRSLVDHPTSDLPCNQVAVVVRPNSIDRQEAVAARRSLEAIGMRNLGLIINLEEDE